MTNHTEKQLADYFLNAIENDYLISLLITSHTQGKLKSNNAPFGMGKTTLEFWLNYYLNGKNWDKTFATTKYNPYDFACLLDPEIRVKEGRLNCACWDDMQATAPAEQGVPRAIRRLASYLTTSRPEVACIIASADNINSVSSPLRKIFLFEAIVAERGLYEIQKISYHKNYKRPLKDFGRLEYLEEGTFPKLPEEQEKRFIEWRVHEKLKIFPSLQTELATFAKLKEWSTDDPLSQVITLNLPVVRNGRNFSINLPDELGAKLHRQQVQVAIAKTQ